jgi:hypothetical protein
MEYFLGSLITLVTLYVAFRFNKEKISKPNSFIKYSQAYKNEALKDIFMKIISPKKLAKTQSTNYLRKISTKILFFNDSAYWIKDNALYTADLIEGEVDEKSTRTVDTMGMDKVQLDKTIFIVSKLREGIDDDRSNTGN